MTSTYDFMRQARRASEMSDCLRRKIGVVIGGTNIKEILGTNSVGETCEVCRREHKSTVECRAVHAEVDAIARLLRDSEHLEQARHMFVWAEVPCQQCLTFISAYTHIDQIHCLTPSSYAKFYPRVLSYGDALAERRSYAKVLGIEISELDAELFI